MGDEITYPFPYSSTMQPFKFGYGQVFQPTFYTGYEYLSNVRLKLKPL